MNLLFDFDHTLAVDNRLEESVLAEMAEKFCGNPPEREAILEAMGRFRSGEKEVEEAIDEAFRRWHCPRPERLSFHREFEKTALLKAKSQITPFPGALETVARLHQAGIPIAIFSNGWTKLQHEKAKIIGFPGPVIASEEIGAWKPDPKAFHLALSRLKWNPSDTAYVGDSPETDIVGAKNAGLKAIWADLEGTVYPSGLIPPDWTIRSLPELLKIGTHPI